MALLLECASSRRVHIGHAAADTSKPSPEFLHLYNSVVKQEDQDARAMEGMEIVKVDEGSEEIGDREADDVSFRDMLDVRSLLNLRRHSSVSLIELRRHAKYVKQRAAYVIHCSIALLLVLESIREWACRMLSRP